MIKVTQISKRIKDTQVLKNIEFEVNGRQIVGVVGPNGAGKTTLLNIIAGIWQADSGDVEIDGISLKEAKDDIRQKIGYIPDAPFLYPRLTGREFLSFVGSLYALRPEILNRKISELEKALELSFWLDELMEGYPRGVRQKMTFAAMLLHSPQIILLDEPLTNLDPKSSKLVKELLLTLAERGASILLSTHILEVAEKLCRRIVVIHKGTQVAAGSLQELKAIAKNPGAGLEEIFLQLTGGEKYTELLKYIS
jgi:ABC-2 type transport system ATP-binding protein